MNVFRMLYQFFRIGLLTEMEYRANFFIQVFQSGLNFGTGLLGVFIVFSHTESLNGWSALELMALLGVFYMMGGVIQFVIEPGMQRFMEDVRLGTLDYVLLKPQDSQLMVSIRKIQIFKLIDVILGVSVLVYAVLPMKASIGWINVLAFVATLFCGSMIVYSFWFFLATLSIWFVRIENILFIFQGVYQAGRWPVDIYPKWMRIALTFVVPVAFATTIPARNLTGTSHVGYVVLAGVVSTVMFVLARLFWRRALRFYSGAGA